jgi:tRNA (guanosine-2'-O-)-methyltransferase
MLSLCPHTEPFLIGGEAFSAQEVIDALAPCLLDERRVRLDEVVAARTYTVTPVLEGLYDRGNASAVLRSAEGLGYQRVHIVDSSENFKEANRVTQGAEKWLDLAVWADTASCVEYLRAHGYRIVATHFEHARPIGEFDFTTPTALFFGNEKDGVSAELLDLADERMVIPMPGFTRSFNISVAAALSLYHVQQDRIRRLGAHGDLDDATRRILTASYYLRSLASADQVLLRTRES